MIRIQNDGVTLNIDEDYIKTLPGNDDGENDLFPILNKALAYAYPTKAIKKMRKKTIVQTGMDFLLDTFFEIFWPETRPLREISIDSEIRWEKGGKKTFWVYIKADGWVFYSSGDTQEVALAKAMLYAWLKLEQQIKRVEIPRD